MEPIRWSASFWIDWRTVLAFDRRRAELLDWFEANIDIASFVEDEEFIGIGVGRQDRLVVARDHLGIYLLEPTADGSPLAMALDGTLDVLQPRDARLSILMSTWSAALEGSYENRSASFAHSAPGLSDRAFDCAILADLRFDEATAQVEYGIVDDEQLRERLEDPQMGRIARSVHRPAQPIKGLPALEPVSLFADISWFPRPMMVSSAADILVELGKAIDGSRQLVQELKSAV